MKKTKYKIIKASSLCDSTKEKMFELFDKYYRDITYELFREDLKNKTHIIMLYSEKKELIGFSTAYRKLDRTPDGHRFMAMFSGDTVLHADYWGTKALQKAFFIYVVQSKVAAGIRPLYWFLQSKGHKTYLMMRRNLSNSYPNYQTKTPVKFKKISNYFYASKYSENFDFNTGIITFDKSKGAVKVEVDNLDKKRINDPDVSFFLEKNTDYLNGAELACIAEIRYSDFFGYVPKYFLKS